MVKSMIFTRMVNMVCSFLRKGHADGGSVYRGAPWPVTWSGAERHADAQQFKQRQTAVREKLRAELLTDGDYDDEAALVAEVIARACWTYNECDRLGRFDNQQLIGMAALMKTVAFDQAHVIMDALAREGYAVGKIK